MSSLRLLQSQFLAYLRAPLTQMQGAVVDTAKISADSRLKIYADAYRLRLIDALADNYPILHTLIGDDTFTELGARYLETQPSRHFSIRHFGHRLAEFVTVQSPYAQQPVLADLAHFEWALRDVFDAADALALTHQDLAAIAPELWPDMRFKLHPTVRRLDLTWNAPAIWKALDEQLDPPVPQINQHSIAWLIWRHDLKIQFRSLQVDEAWAIDALRLNTTFAELCAGLCEWVDESHASLHAAQFIQRWLTDGILSNDSVSTPIRSYKL